MHKAALCLYDIYQFQQHKVAHYCMWEIGQDSHLRLYRLCNLLTGRVIVIQKRKRQDWFTALRNTEEKNTKLEM